MYSCCYVNYYPESMQCSNALIFRTLRPVMEQCIAVRRTRNERNRTITDVSSATHFDFFVCKSNIVKCSDPEKNNLSKYKRFCSHWRDVCEIWEDHVPNKIVFHAESFLHGIRNDYSLIALIFPRKVHLNLFLCISRPHQRPHSTAVSMSTSAPDQIYTSAGVGNGFSFQRFQSVCIAL